MSAGLPPGTDCASIALKRRVIPLSEFTSERARTTEEFAATLMVAADWEKIFNDEVGCSDKQAK
jgi:hypothetical protein